jgi:hypothetical protein
MAENFKKRPHLKSADPALEHGSQAWGNKTTAGKPTKQATKPQQPHLDHRSSPMAQGHGKEKPVTPHHPSRSAGLMSPVASSGTPARINAFPPYGSLHHRHLGPEPVLPKGSQEWGAKGGGDTATRQRGSPNVNADRHQQGGMAALRPNADGTSAPASAARAKPQPHTMAGAQVPRLKHPKTKSIKGLIGKHRNRHALPY